MKRVSVSLLSLIIAVVMSGVISAQDTTMAGAAKTKKTTASKSTAAKRTNFSGTVTAVSATSITAKTAKGDKTAGINEKTKVKDGAGQPKTAGDIKNGDKVRVYASADSSGNWWATTITINPVKAASKAKKTGTN